MMERAGAILENIQMKKGCVKTVRQGKQQNCQKNEDQDGRERIA